MRLTLTATLVLAMLPLGGCGLGPKALTAASTALSLTTLQNTRKTIGDHVVSAATGRDCSILKLEATGEYCPETLVADRSNVYCYRTLADVDCHNLPDPYKNSHRALGSPPPVLRSVDGKGWFD